MTVLIRRTRKETRSDNCFQKAIRQYAEQSSLIDLFQRITNRNYKEGRTSGYNKRNKQCTCIYVHVYI